VLQHVALETSPAQVEAEVAFWALLGFTEVAAPPSLRGRATWLQGDATQIHLLYDEEPVVPPKGHAAVVAEDFEDAFAALEAAGHPIERRREHWGSPRALATSPGGHRVELMAAPPPP
jgi:hypothetical protein